MKEKSEGFTNFKEWNPEVENQRGRKIKYLKIDNGGEYKDDKFLQFAKMKVSQDISLSQRLFSKTELRKE